MIARLVPFVPQGCRLGQALSDGIDQAHGQR